MPIAPTPPSPPVLTTPAGPAAGPTPPAPPSSSVSVAANATSLNLGNNMTITGAGGDTITANNGDTITLSGGNNAVAVNNNGAITITGGGNLVGLHDNSALTINDARSVADNFSGNVTFGDGIAAHNNDTIGLNYSLTLGAAATVNVNFNPALVLGNGDTVNQNYVVNAASTDAIGFSGSGQSVLLNAGAGDTITTAGSNDTITLGGVATTKSSVTIGATASGTTINGGLGTDTFTAGTGYSGGIHYVGSAQDNINGFNAVGTCANYSGLADRVTVNLATGIGTGYDAGGNQLWQDTYTNIQQVKAGTLNGNDLTGSNAYFCELKGGLGSTTFHDGTAGDRIIWSSAGATGLLDGQGLDTAYAGQGDDEFYWRNSPGGKGVSNMGETIYGFNLGQGDDLNLSEFADAGFAGVNKAFAGASDLTNWVNVSLSGSDTLVQFDKSGSGNFTQTAAVLKNDNLFTQYGVANNSTGAQQVVQDLYSAGGLVLAHPH